MASFVPTPGQYYYLVNKKSGKIAALGNSGSTDDGTAIIQWPKSESAEDHKWRLEDAGNGYYYLVNKKSGKVAALGNSGSTNDKTPIIQWPKLENAEDHKWKFEPVTPPASTTTPTTSSTPASLPAISDNGTIKTEAGKTYKVQITVDVAASNSYNNSFGIFAINDDGSVAGVKPTDANYAQTVVKNRLPITAADEGSYKKGQTFQYELPGGPTYSVFLIANGTPALFLEKNPLNQGSKPPLAYFFDTAANPDGKSHIKKISSTQYGFEDVYGGGDQDFDDVIVKIENVSV